MYDSHSDPGHHGSRSHYEQPHYQDHREKDHYYREKEHHHPEEAPSNDMDLQVYVEELAESNTMLEIRENSIEATPTMYDRDTSPSAVADVAPSAEDVKKDEFMDDIDPNSVTRSVDDDVSVQSDLSRFQDRDDQYKDPAYDDASISPLPFDYEALEEVDDPESLMDIPDNIMSLPIAQFEPLEPGTA